MLGGVAVTNSNCAVFESVKVYNDALWGADFVLLAIAFANVAGVVPGDIAVFGAKLVVDFFGFGDEFGFVFETWGNAVSIWGKIFRELENGAGFAVDFVFGVS